MSTHNQKQNKSLLSRLRTAVQKVKLLISSTILNHTWNAAKMLRGASLSNRQLSFNDRPGLMMCSSDETDSEGSVSPSPCLQRTISFPSDEDDIDKRSEIFIANFRRQLLLERQISLQLRYCREQKSSGLISPWIYIVLFLFLFFFSWVWLCLIDIKDDTLMEDSVFCWKDLQWDEIHVKTICWFICFFFC